MKLIECYIENFGKLSSHRLKFDGGMNSYVHENGYGKTTVTAFIKAMLYGLSDTKKADLDENDRRHYLPWGGGVCGGWLTFSAGGGEYRIERTFAQKAQDDTFAIYDLNLGKPTGDYTENVGRELFGIDKDGFERTVFLSERNLSGKNENKSISEKLSDTAGVDCDMGAMDEALKMLEQRRKYYFKRGGGGEIGETEAQLKRTRLQIEKLSATRDEYNSLNERLSAIKTEKLRLEEKRASAQKQVEKCVRANESKALAEHYKKISEELDKKRERLRALDEFFKNGVPTHEKIQSARMEKLRSEQLYASIAKSENEGELRELSDRLCGITKEDISSAIARQGTSSTAFKSRLIIPGIALIILGVALLFAHTAIASAVLSAGVILSVLSITVGKNKQNTSAEVEELLKRIPNAEYSTKLEGLQILYDEHVRLQLLRAEATASEQRAAQTLERASELQQSAEQFLALYPTVTDAPYEEISALLTERQSILAALADSPAPTADFSDRNGTECEIDETEARNMLFGITENASKLEGEAMQLQRRISLLEAELEEEDTLLSYAEEAEEKLKEYENNLFCIQKAKELLEAARDSITARYLSKTKAAFDGYMELIGQVGEYTLDTSFEVSKSEYGSSRKAEAYSLGQRNIQYLVTRLAVTDALYEDETPFLIFDDPFISFDDAHTSAAIEILKKLSRDRQIIYFTCSESRKIT